MASISLSPTYDRLTDYLVEKATPEEILAFKISEAEEQHAIELLDKQDSGTLTPTEDAELAQMREVDALVGLLKAKALAALNRP